jgi:hypothetical protein
MNDLCLLTAAKSKSVKVILRPIVSGPVCLGVRNPSRTRDQIFSFFLKLFWESYGVFLRAAPSLTRSRVCRFQFLLGIASARLLYLFPPRNRIFEVEITVCLGVGHPFGAHDQALLFPFFCRKIALLFVLGRPLWREDGSVICSVFCQWSESWRTHNHTLLSHLRLLGSLSIASYDSQVRWGEVRWGYFTTYGQSVSQSVSMSWCRAALWGP